MAFAAVLAPSPISGKLKVFAQALAISNSSILSLRRPKTWFMAVQGAVSTLDPTPLL
jgi:hypothetical protein